MTNKLSLFLWLWLSFLLEKRFYLKIWPERGRAAGRVCLATPTAGRSGRRRWKRQIDLKQTAEQHKKLRFVSANSSNFNTNDSKNDREAQPVMALCLLLMIKKAVFCFIPAESIYPALIWSQVCPAWPHSASCQYSCWILSAPSV